MSILYQLDKQPDPRWSCRARALLFRLLDMIEFESNRLMNPDSIHHPLVGEVLEYIHLHIGEELSVPLLCKLFHTNHTYVESKIS